MSGRGSKTDENISVNLHGLGGLPVIRVDLPKKAFLQDLLQHPTILKVANNRQYTNGNLHFLHINIYKHCQPIRLELTKRTVGEQGIQTGDDLLAVY